MTTLRRGAPQLPAPRTHIDPRAVAGVLAAALAVALAALVLVLATSPGAGGESVRVAPSAPLPPSPAERGQPAELNGPGMRR